MITNSRDQHHWEVTLSQPLFSGFAISARHRLAELGLETRELELQQTLQAIALQVRQRCYDLLMAGRTLKVAGSSEAALAAHEADVAQFHENGLVPLNDLLKARVARGRCPSAATSGGSRHQGCPVCLVPAAGKGFRKRP